MGVEAMDLSHQDDDRSRAVLLLGSVAVAIVVYLLLTITRRKNRNLPPYVSTSLPFVGGLLKFVKGPIPLIREQYGTLGSVFTVKILTRNITFLLGPEVSAHFFKAQEADLSQREVPFIACPFCFFPISSLYNVLTFRLLFL